MSSYPAEFESAAFWVLLCFTSLGIWLLMQGYWTRWAHRRLDRLEREHNECRDMLKEVIKKLEEVEHQSPYPWLRKVKS